MIPTDRRLFRTGAAGLALFLALGASAAGAAESGSAARTPAPPREDRLTPKEAGREFLRDAGLIWSSPARIRGKDLFPLLGLAAAGAVLIASDESVSDGVRTYAGRHPWVGDVSSVITQAGGLAGFATAGAFFGAGLIFKDARARDTGYLAASAILQSFLVDNFLKSMSGRQRPFFADGEDHWTGPPAFFRRFGANGSEAYGSFPSGHAAAAFSLATVVALQYRNHVWVPILSYTLAGAAGLSRITLDKHWASDVVVGALVGHLIGRLVVRNHDRPGRLVPMAACTGRGFAIGVFYDLGPPGM